MTLHRVDPRFCLPRVPRTAAVLDGLDGWRTGLEEAGVMIVGLRGAPDLVVAGTASAEAAASSGAELVLIEGRGGSRQLRRAGLHADRFLVRPDAERPQFLLPLERPNVADYAVRTWSGGSSRAKAARNRLASRLVRGRLLPEIGSVVAIACRQPGSPYVVRAAEELGVPPDAGWLLGCGRADALSRNVFHLFEPDAREPSWVLKFARVPGYADPFLRDERGLAAARDSAVASLHAPMLVGRFRVDGLEASLESAAAGRTLRDVLLAPGPERDKLAVIDAIASWLVDLATSTASPSHDLDAERNRLLDDVLSAWDARSGMVRASSATCRRYRQCSSTTTSAPGISSPDAAGSQRWTGRRRGDSACRCGISSTSSPTPWRRWIVWRPGGAGRAHAPGAERRVASLGDPLRLVARRGRCAGDPRRRGRIDRDALLAASRPVAQRTDGRGGAVRVSTRPARTGESGRGLLARRPEAGPELRAWPART